MDEVALHASFANASAGSQALAAAELHVWAVPLHGDPERLGALLSTAERQRLQRFHFADHRRRYQIGHGALRAILGGYLGIDPMGVEFTQGPRGKPYLAGQPAQSPTGQATTAQSTTVQSTTAQSTAGPSTTGKSPAGKGPKATVAQGPYFNLSHSGKLALIGISHSELGLDVEKVRHLESLTEIARKHFSPTEFAALDALQGDARELAFYRCWTRKEAYIKAIGEGLSMPLDTFDVSLCEEPKFLACRDGREDPAKWSMLDISPGPEFVGAVAIRALGVKVKRFRLEGA